MSGRCTRWLGMIVVAVGLQVADADGAEAPVAEAPFGLAWASRTDMPRPALMDHEANITALIYFRGHAPATGADTQEVVLEVCPDEGLQRVIWFSRVLSLPEQSDLYEQILAEGIRRHGTFQPGPYPRSVIWPAGVLLGVRTAAGWGEQIVMVSEGDGFSRCSGRHRLETGHPAIDHVAELFKPSASRPPRIRSQDPAALPHTEQQ